jgi:hypothetical protein
MTNACLWHITIRPDYSYKHFRKGYRIAQKGYSARFLLFILLFFFPLFSGGKRINKVVVKSHAFLFDQDTAVKIRQNFSAFFLLCIAPHIVITLSTLQ